MNDGTRSRQGRSRQEGQSQEGSWQERQVGFDPTPIYHAMTLGRPEPVPERPPDAAPADAELCQICHTPNDAEHAARRHTFTPMGARVDTSQFAPTRSERRGEGRTGDTSRRTPYGAPQAQAAPFDPVLRKALLDKGIISVDDLDAASREIQAFTQAVTGGYNAGTGTSTVRSDAAGPGVRSSE